MSVLKTTDTGKSLAAFTAQPNNEKIHCRPSMLLDLDDISEPRKNPTDWNLNEQMRLLRMRNTNQGYNFLQNQYRFAQSVTNKIMTPLIHQNIPLSHQSSGWRVNVSIAINCLEKSYTSCGLINIKSYCTLLFFIYRKVIFQVLHTILIWLPALQRSGGEHKWGICTL